MHSILSTIPCKHHTNNDLSNTCAFSLVQDVLTYKQKFEEKHMRYTKSNEVRAVYCVLYYIYIVCRIV